jgi:hypothetical protein
LIFFGLLEANSGQAARVSSFISQFFFSTSLLIDFSAVDAGDQTAKVQPAKFMNCKGSLAGRFFFKVRAGKSQRLNRAGKSLPSVSKVRIAAARDQELFLAVLPGPWCLFEPAGLSIKSKFYTAH